MDIKWLVDEAMNMGMNGGCKLTAIETILNTLALSEQDTIGQYEYMKQCIIKLTEDSDEKLKQCSCVIAKMIDGIIEDERNHATSANKAAAVLKGVAPPKAEEYDKAAKGGKNDTDTI